MESVWCLASVITLVIAGSAGGQNHLVCVLPILQGSVEHPHILHGLGIKDKRTILL